MTRELQDDLDNQLVRQFQKGDRQAFETFVRRHQERLFRLSNAMLFDNSLCDDAVQEVFVRAYTGLPRFRFASTPFTWLYKTLKNVCSELNRKQGKTKQYVETEDIRNVDMAHLDDGRELDKIFSSLSKDLVR